MIALVILVASIGVSAFATWRISLRRDRRASASRSH